MYNYVVHINICFCIFCLEYLCNFQKLHQDPQTKPQALLQVLPTFRRSMYIIGLMLRFFDFTDKEVISDVYPVSFQVEISNNKKFVSIKMFWVVEPLRTLYCYTKR